MIYRNRWHTKMLVLIIIVAVLWIYFVWSRRHLYWLSWKMPGPPAPIPIVGNIMGMWNEEGKSINCTSFNTHFASAVNNVYLHFAGGNGD